MGSIYVKKYTNPNELPENLNPIILVQAEVRTNWIPKLFLLQWEILAPLVGVFCTHLEPPKCHISKHIEI